MRRSPLVVLLATLTAAALVAPGAGSAAADRPPGAERAVTAVGGVRNILPPGSNGNVTAFDLLALGGSRTATGTSPEHFADQLERYDALTTKDPSKLTRADLDALYKDAGFTPLEVVSTETPREGVTIRRDGFGVPFIDGVTFADVEFGAGYAAIQDRMFLMDVLRHTGAARITEFVGDSEANVAMDASQLRAAYYTRAEAAAQVEKAARDAGKDGAKLLAAVDAFIEGINAAQGDLCPVVTAPSCPAEYAALQKTPQDWDRADVVYVASLVGGIFGKGGGGEVDNAAWLQALTKRFGAKKAHRIYDDLREKNDPEAPSTSDIRTPYQGGGIDPDRPGVALPDPDGPLAGGTGTLVDADGEPVDARAAATPGSLPRGVDLPDGSFLDLRLQAHGMSNALLVTGKESRTGKPLAVFGPQTGYFAPQLLVEQVLNGPGIQARGVAFAGTNLFVQLGRGVDYAWSATSAGADNIDIVAERLCDPDGGAATVTSTGYQVGRAGKKRCVAMDRAIHTETTTPAATSPAPPRTYRFLVLRTHHGVVQQRTTVRGRPVALVAQRSTYGHEVDSVLGFAQLNDPGYVRDAATFQKATSHIDFTFNWFYADSRDISYYSSGLLPIRSPKVDVDLPRWGDPAYDWKGWLGFRGHPRQTNPERGYLVSWNNKQAPGFAAADDTWSYGPVYRSLALEDRLTAAIAGRRKIDILGMTGVMAEAAVADSRAAATLPWVLKVLGNDPGTAKARGLLKAWLRDGALRVDRDRDGSYAHEAAIALFDAWWTGDAEGRDSLPRDVLRGRLGRLVDVLPQKLDDHPRLGIGSAWNGIAWYGYVQKDLRRVLGAKVRAPYRYGYCGSGKLAACRTTLRASLAATVSRVTGEQQVGAPGDLTYDKSQDFIRAVTAGVVGVRPIDWQNRPTFQQVVEFSRRR